MQRLFGLLSDVMIPKRYVNNVDDVRRWSDLSESVESNVDRLRGGGSDLFYSLFVVGGVLTTIVGLIVILLGSAGPSFGAVTAGIILIGIGIGSTVCGIVNCIQAENNSL